MTVGFKHIASKFADGFASGRSIKIGTFEHYRAKERTTSTERGDSLEGRAVNHLTQAGPNSGQALIDRLIRAQFTNNPAIIQNNFFSNITIVRECAGGYIFCLSNKPDSRLIAAGQVCFRIANVEKFAKLLGRSNHLPLGRAKVSSVQYEARSVDLNNADPVFPDPFRKNHSFAWENEIRIFWPVQELTSVDNHRILSCLSVAPLISKFSLPAA